MKVKHLLYKCGLLMLLAFHYQAQAKINVMMVEPDRGEDKTLYEAVKGKLNGYDSLDVTELSNYASWKLIRGTHDQDADSDLIEERHSYYEDFDINFYVEVFQKKKSGKFYYEVFIYADSVNFEFSWFGPEILDENKDPVLHYNIEKIKYCLYFGVKKKDMVLVLFNNLMKPDMHSRMKSFPSDLLSEIEAKDAEIRDKYSFKREYTNGGQTEDQKNAQKLYDVLMNITIRPSTQEDKPIEVEIELTHILDDVPLFIVDEFSYAKIKESTRDLFLVKARDWLLNIQ